MDVRAIIAIGGPSDTGTQSQQNGHLAETPYALTDVLGKPLAFRVIDNLKRHDIHTVSVVTDTPCESWPVGTSSHGSWTSTKTEQLWTALEEVFSDFAQDGAEVVVFLRLGPYTEIDYNQLIQFHLDRNAHVTAAVDDQNVPLDIFVLSASRRNDAAYLFRNQLHAFRTGCEFCPVSGYINRLSSPNHLRQLAIEGLMGRIQIAPEGEQVKPGVWLGRGAQVHKRARILSPAFIGAGSRVRAAAVVTRCSALEHHTVVDCGTVVENVTTLPYTYLGAGLDVAHSVVGHSRICNLKRGVEVEFSDPRLIGQASAHAPLRALGSLLSLASFFPAQFLRGLFAPSHRECPPSLPEAIAAPAAALETPAPIKAPAPAVDAGEFPSQLVIARRYGNE